MSVGAASTESLVWFSLNLKCPRAFRLLALYSLPSIYRAPPLACLLGLSTTHYHCLKCQRELTLTPSRDAVAGTTGPSWTL